jgi:hypothetical protein
MKWDEVIIGTLAIVWGIVLLFMRPEILELGRDGGRGLRNRKVINALVIAAIILLPIGGIAIILVRGL